FKASDKDGKVFLLYHSIMFQANQSCPVQILMQAAKNDLGVTILGSESLALSFMKEISIKLTDSKDYFTVGWQYEPVLQAIGNEELKFSIGSFIFETRLPKGQNRTPDSMIEDASSRIGFVG